MLGVLALSSSICLGKGGKLLQWIHWLKNDFMVIANSVISLLNCRGFWQNRSFNWAMGSVNAEIELRELRRFGVRGFRPKFSVIHSRSFPKTTRFWWNLVRSFTITDRKSLSLEMRICLWRSQTSNSRVFWNCRKGRKSRWFWKIHIKRSTHPCLMVEYHWLYNEIISQAPSAVATAPTARRNIQRMANPTQRPCNGDGGAAVGDFPEFVISL